MRFVVSNAGVPAGTYPATFECAEPFDDRQGRYEQGVMLKFRVTSGDHEGHEATRIVSQRCTPLSNLYGFAQALAGRTLEVGESVDFAIFRGVTGLIVVEQTEGGATRVAAFLRAAE